MITPNRATHCGTESVPPVLKVDSTIISTKPHLFLFLLFSLLFFLISLGAWRTLSCFQIIYLLRPRGLWGGGGEGGYISIRLSTLSLALFLDFLVWDMCRCARGRRILGGDEVGGISAESVT